MGDYTITLTSDQEKAVVWAKNTYDPKMTPKQYLLMVINELIEGYRKSAIEVDIPTVKEAYVNANDTVKDQVKTLLGL